MANIDDSDIKEFLIEANDLLEEAENEILNAERGQSTKYFDAVFRAFHSIKGGAGMLGLNELQTHMHKVESQWGLLKENRFLTKFEIDYFLASIDSGRKLLSGQAVNFDYTAFDKYKDSSLAAGQTIKSAEAKVPTIRTGPSNTVPSKQKAKSRIFVIDDEKDIITILKDMFDEDDQFEVSYFLDGKSAIAEAKTKPPEVILTDFRMPEMSGLEVLQAAKKTCPDVPVILLTAFLTKELLVESLSDGGFFGALEKPVKQNDLIKECLAAVKHSHTKKALRRSLNILVYQFADLEKFLILSGKTDVAKAVGNEIRELLKLQK